MKPRKPKPKAPPKDSPTEIAAAAGCSKALAHRLLARGMTRAEIIERAWPRTSGGKRDWRLLHQCTVQAGGYAKFYERRERSRERSRRPDRHSELCRPKVSRAERMQHLAQLRGIEVQSKRRDLLPIEPLLSVCFSGLQFMKQRLMALPPELGVDFGRTLEKALSQRLEHIFAEARRVNEQECAKAVHGIRAPEPPPAPMPPPELPATYQQYERGSTTGAVDEYDGARTEVGTVESG